MWVMMYGRCYTCEKDFGFNPHKVPSLRDAQGVRQAVCKECVELANVIRLEKGLEPFTVHPDAYEPLPEHEL